jgi:predicted PurR-regulated permease PerM
MQSLVNACFGLAVAAGLWLLGVPYPFLWGVLAAMLRFIPYVGTWMAALLPIALSLAVFPGWTKPLLVIALFAVLEPFIYAVVEPLLYGHSIGVSQTALLVAVAFWTWLWGPLGLILATPLTVCLVVLGKYVPELDFIVPRSRRTSRTTSGSSRWTGTRRPRSSRRSSRRSACRASTTR